jgi:phage recombination protein Bet
MKSVALKDNNNMIQQSEWERFNLNPHVLQAIQEYRLSPEIWSALKNSIFPGAHDESILLAIDYCRAKKLDIMMQPVHIVPMPVKGVFRDVIMPGIGLSRVQASRSGCHLGTNEPEFGPNIEDDLDGVKITYPEWCKVTVRAIVQGHIAEFTAKQLWLENYAKVKDSKTKEETRKPNAIWKKRPYAMLAKCTESQALKMAFPELIGQQPTAEEMMGKEYEDFDDGIKNVTPKAQSLSSRLDKVLDLQPSKLETNSDLPEPEAPEQEIVPVICEETNKKLAELVRAYNISDEKIHTWCVAANINTLEEMDKERAIKYIKLIKEKYINNENK